jgi:hypothetical protein
MTDSRVPPGDEPNAAGGVSSEPRLPAALVVAAEDVPAKSRKALIWIIAAVAAFLVLAVGAVITVVVLVNSARDDDGGGSGDVSGAESLAKEYVQAIADGDAKRANEIALTDMTDENNIMLTEAVLSKAERIREFSVRGVVGRGDAASAQVRFKLGSRGYQQYIALEKDDHGWYVATALTPRVSVPYASGAEFSVPGLKGSLDPSTFTQVAYPAVYKLDSATEFLTVSEGARLTVASGAGQPKGVKVTPSRAYLDAVAAVLKARIDECRVNTSRDALRDCGLAADYPEAWVSSDTESLAVTIAEYPAVVQTVDGSLKDFTVEGGVMSAALTGFNYQGTPVSETVDVKPYRSSLRAEIVDGKVEVK